MKTPWWLGLEVSEAIPLPYELVDKAFPGDGVSQSKVLREMFGVNRYGSLDLDDYFFAGEQMWAQQQRLA